MLRIALVVPEFHGEKGPGGGINTMAESLSADLASVEGVEVEIVSLRMSRHAPQNHRAMSPATWARGPRITTRTVGGITVHDVGSWFAEWEVLRNWPRGQLARLIRSFDVAVVLAGSPAAAHAVLGSGVPVVCYAASLVLEERRSVLAARRGPRAWLTRFNTYLMTSLERSVLRRADVAVAINPAMQEVYRRLGAGRVELLPPTIDINVFSPTGLRSADGPILTVGRLADPRKGIDRLLRAYARALAEVPNLPDLVLAGRQGPTDDNLRLARELGIDGKVEVVVPIPDGGLADVYRRSSVFVMSSHEEGFGIVAIEAMACGLPVVATDTEGSRFVFESEPHPGLLVDRGDHAVEEIAEALVALRSDPAWADGLALRARQVVIERFSRKAAVGALLDVVGSVSTTVAPSPADDLCDGGDRA